jgi:catechol 2,3-dioxygenase-like lactoylglutathione lyase family enzyme
MSPSGPTSSRPARLHHHAFVVRDQEVTRRFYEDVVGLPLVATWCEEEDFGQGPMAYCHTFYELEDGSCLAFFQFADPAFTAEQAGMASTSLFDHVALHVSEEVQAAVRGRAEQAGMPAGLVDHGYCRSLYLRDPDGLIVELTVDDPRALRESPARRERARAELARWLAGDRTVNNALRGDDGE